MTAEKKIDKTQTAKREIRPKQYNYYYNTGEDSWVCKSWLGDQRDKLEKRVLIAFYLAG